MLDAGFSLLDACAWDLDTGSLMLDTRRWVPDACGANGARIQWSVVWRQRRRKLEYPLANRASQRISGQEARQGRKEGWKK